MAAPPNIAALPSNLKQVQHYMKTATEHDKRNPVISYYCRLYAMQKAMEIDKSSPGARQFLMSLMDYLEKAKTSMAQEEAVHNEVAGQAHVENYALKMFLYADNEDRAGRFNKNVVKSFYTAGMLLDVLTNFGELEEDLEKNRKYAKWKAAYIHKCLKNGETPISGPLPEEGEEEEEGAPGQVPLGFDSSQPSLPINNMTISQDTGGWPGQGVGHGAQAPPTTPMDPAHHGYPAAQPPSSQGGYQPAPQPIPRSVPPQQPAAAPTTYTAWTPPPNPAGVKLTAEQFQRGIKLCKYATSAMQYEDAPTAIDNLTKALKLLTSGKEI